MRVLIGCSYKPAVRDAFLRRGHDAWSCDFLDCETLPERHIKGDVRDILDDGWDLMIAHPPCTYLANSGLGHFFKGQHRELCWKRWALMEDAVKLFKQLLGAKIARIAIENPVMHPYATALLKESYTQIVHPWWFGDPHNKKTCLWLKNLPKLAKTNETKLRLDWMNNIHSGPGRWKVRSSIKPGMSEAFAEFWG